MNTKNNKRRKESQQKIESAFIELLQTREINKITVSDVIKNTDLNRSTFYANYTDIFDLADKVRVQFENDFSSLFADYDYFNERSGALKFFSHVKENQKFYKTYFKLCYDEKHFLNTYDPARARKENIDKNLKYHIEFFRNGFNAILKMWLANDCKESPEEMTEILQSEYRGR